MLTRNSRISDVQPSSPNKKWQHDRDIKCGSRVLVNGILEGTVRFIGEVHFKEGLWVGVEIDRRHGNIDRYLDPHQKQPRPNADGRTSRPSDIRTAAGVAECRRGTVDGRSYLVTPRGFCGLLAPVHRVNLIQHRMEGVRGNVTMRKKKSDSGKQGINQRRGLQLGARRTADKGLGPELNRTFTSSASPDVVASCDPLTMEAASSEASTDSKRSSASLDDSFGILTPGQMKDFSVNSMTQSVTSNCSMVKDISWDDLQTVTDETASKSLWVNESYTNRSSPSSNLNSTFSVVSSPSSLQLSEATTGHLSSLQHDPVSSFTSSLQFDCLPGQTSSGQNLASEPGSADLGPESGGQAGSNILDTTYNACEKMKHSLNQTFDASILKRLNSSSLSEEDIELEVFNGQADTTGEIANISRNVARDSSDVSRHVARDPTNISRHVARDKFEKIVPEVFPGNTELSSPYERWRRKGERFSLDTDKLLELESLSEEGTYVLRKEKKLNSTFHVTLQSPEAPIRLSAKHVFHSSLSAARTRTAESTPVADSRHTTADSRHTTADSRHTTADSRLMADSRMTTADTRQITGADNFSQLKKSSMLARSESADQFGLAASHSFRDAQSPSELLSSSVLTSSVPGGVKTQLWDRTALLRSPADLATRTCDKPGPAASRHSVSTCVVSGQFGEKHTTLSPRPLARPERFGEAGCHAASSVSSPGPEVMTTSADRIRELFPSVPARINQSPLPESSSPELTTSRLSRSMVEQHQQPPRTSLLDMTADIDRELVRRTEQLLNSHSGKKQSRDLTAERLVIPPEPSEGLAAPVAPSERFVFPDTVVTSRGSEPGFPVNSVGEFSEADQLYSKTCQVSQRSPLVESFHQGLDGSGSSLTSRIFETSWSCGAVTNINFQHSVSVGDSDVNNHRVCCGEAETQIVPTMGNSPSSRPSNKDKPPPEEEDTPSPREGEDQPEGGEPPLPAGGDFPLPEGEKEEGNNVGAEEDGLRVTSRMVEEQREEGENSSKTSPKSSLHTLHLSSTVSAVQPAQLCTQQSCTQTGRPRTQHGGNSNSAAGEEVIGCIGERGDNLASVDDSGCAVSRKESRTTAGQHHHQQHDVIIITGDHQREEQQQLGHSSRAAVDKLRNNNRSGEEKLVVSDVKDRGGDNSTGHESSPPAAACDGPPATTEQGKEDCRFGRKLTPPCFSGVVPGIDQVRSDCQAEKSNEQNLLFKGSDKCITSTDTKDTKELFTSKCETNTKDEVKTTKENSTKDDRLSPKESRRRESLERPPVGRTRSPTVTGSSARARSPSARTKSPTEPSSVRSAPNTPESKRRTKPYNKLLEKVQMQSESLVESTCSQSSQGRGSLFDSQYSTDPQSLAVSVTLSTDMESSGFFSDLDGRISKNETQTLDEIDSIQQDSKIDSLQQDSASSLNRKDDICVKLSKCSEGNNDDTAATITLEDVSLEEDVKSQSYLITEKLSSQDTNKSTHQGRLSVEDSPKTVNLQREETNCSSKELDSTEAPTPEIPQNSSNRQSPKISRESPRSRKSSSSNRTPVSNKQNPVKQPSSPVISESEKARQARAKKPGKWDAIMSRIERGKKTDDKKTDKSVRGKKLSRDLSMLSNTSQDKTSTDLLSPRSDRSSLVVSPRPKLSSSRIGDKENRSENKLKSTSQRKESVTSRGSILNRSAGHHQQAKPSVLSAKNSNSPADTTAAGGSVAASASDRGSSTGGGRVIRVSLSAGGKSAVAAVVRKVSSSADSKVSGAVGGGRSTEAVLYRRPGTAAAAADAAAKRRSESTVSNQSRTSTSSTASGGSARNSVFNSGVSVQPVKKQSVTRFSNTKSTVVANSTAKAVAKTNSGNGVRNNSTAQKNNSKVADNNRKNAKVSRASKDGRSRPGHSPVDRGISSGQPDLLKETIRKDSKLGESDQQVQAIKQSARWNCNGFSMMTVVANYYIEKHSEAENRIKELQERINQIQNVEKSGEETEEKDGDEKATLDKHLKEAKAERENIEREHAEAVRQLQDTIEQLKIQRDKQDCEAKSRLDELTEQYTKESEQQKSNFEALLQTRLQEEKSTAESALEQRLKESSLAVENSFQERLTNERQQLEKQLSERHLTEKQQLESQLKDEYTRLNLELETRLKQEHEAEAKKLREAWEEERLASDKKREEDRLAEEKKRDEERAEKKTSQSKKVDYRLEAEKERAGRLEQEVESLRTVLEMKTEELHVSRHTRLKLEETIEEYKQKEDAWRKACAQVEDLKEQLAARLEAERRLMEENQRLNSIMERELNERKRLSMENEQLTWKIKQECESIMSQSLCEGFDYSFTRGNYVGRPGSAPPCKNPLASVSLPFMGVQQGDDEVPPDSPRVMEVVEKLESVSWKLEYDLPENTPSPGMRRKMSPHSPMFLRKCKSSLMTRSLDRSGLLTRSNSSPNTNGSHQLLSRSTSIRRKKSPPQFETLSEYTDESDESKKSTPSEERKLQQQRQREAGAEGVAANTAPTTDPPNPVEIVGGDVEDDLCEISSSSEIEIGGSIADADSVATEDLDQTAGILFQDYDMEEGEETRSPCSRAELATARKLDFKNLLPAPGYDQSPGSEELHSPLTEPTLRQEPNSGAARRSRGERGVAAARRGDGAALGASGAEHDDDLDSDISDSGDELGDSEQVS